jgi:hypothetical protein
MAGIPKWTEERTNKLTELVGNAEVVTTDDVAQAAEALETSTRSVSSKLRKMGYEVESTTEARSKTFSDEEAAELASFVEDNSGKYTYGEIAENVAGGKFSAKQVQGKILSLELTSHVKPTPKKEAVKQYTDAEEAKFLELANSGAFMEEIASAMGKELPSVRGKALSLLRAEKISEMPKQKNQAKSSASDPMADLGDVSGMAVAEIAEKLEKTERGVRTMLTRRGLKASDYDGEAKKAKLASAS